ncbi:MAG: hypothetical protein CALGDGBN_02548 [Pseudomonadales bacterium]|nr:hypothetical protein [Pseudomonadales bacterium]
MKNLSAFVASVSLPIPSAQMAAAPAQEVPATPSASSGAEEQLDEGLKRFGYLAGLARGCVVEAQQPAIEKEIVELHAGIARLLGAYETRAEHFRSRQGGSST